MTVSTSRVVSVMLLYSGHWAGKNMLHWINSMEPNENPTPAPRFRLLQNWISLTGAVFATGSVFAFLLLVAIELFLPRSNPYMGLLLYVVSPFCFFVGLFLVLAGLGLQRRKIVSDRLQIDLLRPRDRKLLVVFVLCALGFLLVSAFGSYQTYQYTESVQFCGTACHVPMKPEYTAYLHSPHARVACVDCHVGAGAEQYVQSKLNGLHQLYDMVTDNIPRPIETPINNLRPARDTCDQCHWPERFIGGIDRTYYHYLSDDKNTPFAVRLLLKVGGGGADGPPSGIHWHVSRGKRLNTSLPTPNGRSSRGCASPKSPAAKSRFSGTKIFMTTRPNTRYAPWTALTATPGRRTSFFRPMMPWTTPSLLAVWTARCQS